MISPVELGDALSRMLDSARLEGDAGVTVSCAAGTITLRAGEWVDASIRGGELSAEDEVALQILGWHPDGIGFSRSWHPTTPSMLIADDVARTARHGLRCESFELHLELHALSQARG